MAIPIFVLGVQRSGTTWLANLLCQHSQLAGVQHERHYGIHESGYFRHIEGRFGDLRQRTNFVEFVEVVCASDYFALAQADRAYLYSLYGQDYAQIFRAVMDRFAEEQHAHYWIEKSPPHTLQVERLAHLYADAKFIGIQRSAVEVIQSQLGRTPFSNANQRRLFIIRNAIRWDFHNRTLLAYQRATPQRIHLIQYEQLRQHTEATLREVCAFVGVTFEPAMLHTPHRRNTSFSSDANAREHILTEREKQLIQVVSGVMGWIPFALMRWAVARFERWRGHTTLPDWFFSLTRSSDRTDSTLGASHL
ncbi:MAG: sulfotransferase family protein [Phototrophicaceae bacterium]